MVGSCAALNCTTRKGAPGISFHRFPHRNPELTKWVHNMKRSDPKICSPQTENVWQNVHSVYSAQKFAFSKT